MKYDGFQRVAQRFEVLWPESIRYATSALQERLSAACFSSNNHPHCPLTCSVELKGNCQNNTGRKKKKITESARPTDVGAAPGASVETWCCGIFLFFMSRDGFVLAGFIPFAVVFLY